MFKKNEFRAILARKEISASEIAKELGIDPATLSRKISGQSDFYRNDRKDLSNFGIIAR